MPKLVIVAEDGSRREVELTTRDLRIGRAPENDVSLPDPTKGVSRMHAELRHENGRYVIIDLNSQNGTWLDGTRVQRADVASGSEIAIGPYRLTLQGAGAAAALPSTQSGDAAPRTPATPKTARLEPSAGEARPAAAAAAPAPAKGAAKRPARPAAPPPAPGPIAALARMPKPILFGGFFAIALVIIVLGQLFGPSAPTPAGGTTGVPAPTDTKPGSETNAGIIERHLVEGKALVEKKEYDAAIRDHFDRILLIEPNHAEATDLKMKAQEALQQQKQQAAAAADAAASTVPSPGGPAATTPPAPAVPPRVVPAPPQPPPPSRGSQPASSANADASRGARGTENLPSARRAGETVQAWRARNADLQAQYTAAKSALDRHQLPAAINGFDALLKTEPGYLDAPQLLARTRAEQRSGGRDAFEAGNKLDAAGSWIQALEQYDRARSLDPSLAAQIEEAAKRVRDKMHAAGAEAFKRARQYDALGRSAEALKEYANAAQWLPADDANRTVARQRADLLKAGVK